MTFMEKVVGQTKDAGFQVGVRKTFTVPVDTAWSFLLSEEGRATWLGKLSTHNFEPGKAFTTKEGIEGTVSVLKPNSHIRLTWKPKHWTNFSAVQVRVIDANGKATISFHQDKMLDGKQREEMKMYWDSILEKIGKQLHVEQSLLR